MRLSTLLSRCGDKQNMCLLKNLCICYVFLYIPLYIKHLCKNRPEAGDSGCFWRRDLCGLDIKVVLHFSKYSFSLQNTNIPYLKKNILSIKNKGNKHHKIISMDNKTKRPEVEVLARLYRQLGFLYMQSPLRLQALVYLDRTAKKQRASVAFFSVPLQLRLKQTWQESFAIYLKGLKRYRWTSSQESPFIAKVAQTQVSFF